MERWRGAVDSGVLDTQFSAAQRHTIQSEAMSEIKPRKDPLSDIQFSGMRPPQPSPPAPAPVRRDSLGRLLNMKSIEALRLTQFRPGQSGNPGGGRKKQREYALSLVTHWLKIGKLKPSDTVADFMNLLYDADLKTLCSQRTPQRILREYAKGASSLIETEADRLPLDSEIGGLLRDSGIGDKKKARR